MAGYIFAIDSAYPEHWEIAKAMGFWDIPNGVSIAPGDAVFFWLTGGHGLVGHAEARSPAEPLSPETPKPWRSGDPRHYTHRVYFHLLSDEVLRQARWRDVQADIDSGARAGNGQISINTDSGVRRLAARFAGGVDALWPNLPVELEIPLDEDSRRRIVSEIAVRSGQGPFREALMNAYGRRCAISGSDVEDVLEAAHIHPYRGQHTNDVRNGLLLRADLHTLFHRCRITATPELVVRLDPRLRRTEYGPFDGQPVRAAVGDSHRPLAALLRSHNERCGWFQAA